MDRLEAILWVLFRVHCPLRVHDLEINSLIDLLRISLFYSNLNVNSVPNVFRKATGTSFGNVPKYLIGNETNADLSLHLLNIIPTTHHEPLTSHHSPLTSHLLPWTVYFFINPISTSL